MSKTRRKTTPLSPPLARGEAEPPRSGIKPAVPARGGIKPAVPVRIGMAVGLRLPMAFLIDGYVARHLDVGAMTAIQSEAMKRLWLGCQGRELNNGRLVRTAPDAIKYVLECLAAGME